MDHLLSLLGDDKFVLDLGCGPGSFHYNAYKFQVLGVDIALPEDGLRPQRPGVRYALAESNRIPLRDQSVDAVICHHTLEHFPDYRATLAEIGRVLRPDGWLWVAIPNGFGFDDAFYRKLFSGGGHVNRFTYSGLIADVEQIAGLELIQSCHLFSSFIYLKKPTAQQAIHYPRTARFLIEIPEGFAVSAALSINTLTRLIDKIAGSRYSQYGWGFIFGRESMTRRMKERTPMDRLPSFFNVCRECGSGIPAVTVASRMRWTLLGIRPFKCPFCGTVNIFVRPPEGLD